jgi:molybdenum cofactor synthesis domain-containing protein
MPLRTDRQLVSIHEARRILQDAAAPITRTETVPLAALGGRVLAEAIVATADVPPFARSAMDGYAVVAADVAGASSGTPVALRVVESVFTGRVPTRAVKNGTCSAIATGAPIPAGADAVVIVERTAREGDAVRVMEAVGAGANINPQGTDLRAGHTVVDEGAWLTPSRIAAIAAAGHERAVVFARPRVAVLVTGDEVVTPGQPLGPGQIHDVNTAALAATVLEHGGVPITGSIVEDDPAAIREAFATALDADLVLVSGGSSVGERDYILDVLAESGDVRFAGIAVKPGKPTVFAIVQGRPVFGMPGNPSSCLSNAYLLVAPMLRRIARLPPATPRTVRARLASRVTSPRGRHQFYTVRVDKGIAQPAFKGSGDITSIANADGYFEIEEATESVEAGTTVDVTLF